MISIVKDYVLEVGVKGDEGYDETMIHAEKLIYGLDTCRNLKKSSYRMSKHIFLPKSKVFLKKLAHRTPEGREEFENQIKRLMRNRISIEK